ncbi:MAG: dicarboxylate/amino acid:cation symporter, partial [Treponema sp.]|nr:dicarboxylate/amino acid:cation symporter [Treponema sp.]
MKLWIKYLIGIVLGFLLSLVLPSHSGSVESIVGAITDFVIRFGRYCVVPLLFFSAVTAVNKLRISKSLGKTLSWTFLIIVVSTVLLICLALVSALLVRLPRIPITAEKVEQIQKIDFAHLVQSLFPFSSFESLSNGAFLLSPFLLAVLVGSASASDQVTFKSIIVLFDSLSKLFYNVAVFFMEMLAIGMIAIMTHWMINSRAVLLGGTFTPLIVMLFVNFLIIAFGLYPLILRYICPEINPYRVLYASTCSTLVSFFSGDVNLVFPINIRTGKESLGIRRGVNGITFPLFSIFARGGSAFICVIGFVAIWRSYAY